MMPKFYIDDGEEQVIVTAKNEPAACVMALLKGKFSSFMVNGVYRISEKGFDLHDDDVEINSDLINQVISMKMNINIEEFIRDFDKFKNKEDKESDE